MIKGVNDSNVEGYKLLIERGNPDFVEAKSYMHVGASQKYHTKEQMPTMDEVVAFSKQLEAALGTYEIVDVHEPSRAVLLMKKSLGKRRYIDFHRFFDIVNAGGEAATDDYSKERMCEN